MNKKGAEKGITYLLVLGMLFLILITWKPDILGGTAASSAEPGTPVATQCLTSDKTTFTFKDDDKYAAGNSRSEASSWFVEANGVRKDTYYSSSDSLTLSPGQVIKMTNIDIGEDDSALPANTAQTTFTVPCTGTLDKLIPIIDVGTAATTSGEWPSDGSLTVLNDEYATIAAAGSNNLVIPSGSSKCTGKIEFIYTNDKGYGSPDGKDCIVFFANKTAIKSLELTGEGVGNAGCKPDGASETQVVAKGMTAGQIDYFSWEIPPFEDSKSYNYKLCVILEDSQDTTSGAQDDVFFEIFDKQYFLNTDNGKPELGYEDEDNKLIGEANIGGNITLA